MATIKKTGDEQNATSVAREAIIALSKRKLAATPTNYTLIYQEIARGHGMNTMTAHEATLLLSARLKNRELADLLHKASEADDWRSFGVALEDALGEAQAAVELVEPLRVKLAEVESTLAALQPAFESGGSQTTDITDLLLWINEFARALKTKYQAFSMIQYADLIAILQEQPASADLPSQLGVWLEGWVSSTSKSSANVTVQTEVVATSRKPVQSQELRTPKRKENSGEILAERLAELLQFLLLNIIEIVPEADVVQDQVAKIDGLLSGLLTMGRLDEVERSLRSMLVRGGIVRHGLEEAKETIKVAVGKLIGRLALMSNATEDYSAKLAEHAKHIASASNMTALSYQINDLLQDTEMLSTEMLKARSDFVEARQHTVLLEQRTRELEQELAKLQKRVHTDPLTDLLDRRSMEEVYSEEIIRADRSGRSLCIALIDIDDMKKIGASHGAHITIEALKHLLQVIQKMTRPSDSVARYGESQMAILLVGAKRDDAVMVMTRLIRELTKSFFMSNDQHIVLTFSCGVAQIDVKGGGFNAAMDQAEIAQREARDQGKNQVMGK